jgi:1-acyl-sn-glycerol-3-phosphate acyltransferase
MHMRFNYYWRWAATGFSMFAFGLCGLFFSLVLFPLTWVWPHRRSRQRIVTAIVNAFFRALVGMLKLLGVMKLDVQGLSKLRALRTAIVVANHPTYLDVMVLLALMPVACCVVKGAHWRNPCFWGIVRAAEYVSNNDPSELIEAGARALQAGYPMIVFPEGTRSPGAERLHPFSRGFAHMALSAGNPTVPMVPVLIDCTPAAFTKGLRWYHVPQSAFHIRVVVLDPVHVDDWVEAGTAPMLAARTLTQRMQTHITQQLIEYGFFKTGNKTAAHPGAGA